LSDKVRVITPIYRPDKYYLREAIASIEAQTYKNITHVIVWDNYDDYYLDCVDYIENRLDTFQIMCRERVGVSSARNIGLDFNRSDYNYVVYLDCDNWVEPTFIENLLSVASEHRVVTCSQNVYEMRKLPASTTVRKATIPNNFKEAILDHNWIDLGCIMHPNDIRIRFDTSLTRLVDWDFIIQFSKQYRFIHYDKVLSHYRMHNDPNRISNSESFPENLKIIKNKWGCK